MFVQIHIYVAYLALVSFSTPGKMVAHHPLGNGCQLTVPHALLGDHTTVEAHLQA